MASSIFLSDSARGLSFFLFDSETRRGCVRLRGLHPPAIEAPESRFTSSRLLRAFHQVARMAAAIVS
jgi:hypothetical protein